MHNIYIYIYTMTRRTEPQSHVSWIRYAGICWMLDWSWTDLLSGFGKGHSNEGRAQCFGVHLHSSSTKVVILPSLHIGWLVPINQPFLNYTRSYACTDSRFCSQRHQPTCVSLSLSLQFFNVDNLLKQTLSYSKKRDKSKRKELIFRVHYFRFINKNREVAVNKWTVKKT